MPADLQRANRNMDVLSRVVLRGYDGDFTTPVADLKPFYPDVEYVAGLGKDGLREFLALANDHHVTIRALTVIQKAAAEFGNAEVVTLCEGVLTAEHSRIDRAIEVLVPICRALEFAGA